MAKNWNIKGIARERQREREREREREIWEHIEIWEKGYRKSMKESSIDEEE